MILGFSVSHKRSLRSFDVTVVPSTTANGYGPSTDISMPAENLVCYVLLVFANWCFESGWLSFVRCARSGIFVRHTSSSVLVRSTTICVLVRRTSRINLWRNIWCTSSYLVGGLSAFYGEPAPAASYGAPAPSNSFGAPAPAVSFSAPAPAVSFARSTAWISRASRSCRFWSPPPQQTPSTPGFASPPYFTSPTPQTPAVTPIPVVVPSGSQSFGGLEYTDQSYEGSAFAAPAPVAEAPVYSMYSYNGQDSQPQPQQQQPAQPTGNPADQMYSKFANMDHFELVSKSEPVRGNPFEVHNTVGPQPSFAEI